MRGRSADRRTDRPGAPRARVLVDLDGYDRSGDAGSGAVVLGRTALGAVAPSGAGPQITDAGPADRIIAALHRRGLRIRDLRILALGIATKADSAETSASNAIAIVEHLQRLGGHVRVVDPYAPTSQTPPGTVRVELTVGEVVAADVVVVLVGHARFDYQLVEEAAALVIDHAARLHPSAIVERA